MGPFPHFSGQQRPITSTLPALSHLTAARKGHLLLRSHAGDWAHSDRSGKSPQLKVPNIKAICKSLTPVKVTRAQVLGAASWGDLEATTLPSPWGNRKIITQLSGTDNPHTIDSPQKL